jgi:MSHA pilin protein MshA
MRSKGQAGFTLIELIVVIVILGILAATALPKFANLGADARFAKMKAAQGAIMGAASMYHGRWLAAGSPTTATSYDTPAVAVNGTGYPTNDGIAIAAGLTDYHVTRLSGEGYIFSDANHATTNCYLHYNAATGVVTVTASVANCE